MVINRFVFVWFVLLLFLFCPENAVSRNRVWSDVWPPRRNSTYLLFVLVSTLANVTSPGCEERGREQKHHKKDPTQWWFRQEDRRRSSLPLASPLAGGAEWAGTSRRDVVAPNHAYQCGKKMKSTYLETTVFLATVCPVRFFAPAKTTDGTF